MFIRGLTAGLYLQSTIVDKVAALHKTEEGSSRFKRYCGRGRRKGQDAATGGESDKHHESHSQCL